MIGSLEGVTHINGKKVMTNADRPRTAPVTMGDMGEVDWEAFDKMREEFPICIDHEKDMISVKMLTKPASEGGNLELCQLTELVGLGREILRYVNAKYPCRENAMSLTKLDEFFMWQEERTKNRTARGVEGKNEK